MGNEVMWDEEIGDGGATVHVMVLADGSVNINAKGLDIGSVTTLLTRAEAEDLADLLRRAVDSAPCRCQEVCGG